MDAEASEGMRVGETEAEAVDFPGSAVRREPAGPFREREHAVRREQRSGHVLREGCWP